tara:strand:+ start:3621 stop:4025 length:405 start_codon:yes stop_codon:yes gene_type:complete
MKQSTISALKKIIEEAVQKEVAKQIKIVVQEIVNPPIPTNNVESNALVEDKPKINVKDPVLNQILNETEGGIQAAQEPYPTMGGGAYTSDRMTEVAGVTPTGQPTGNMPDFMKKAMSGHSAKVVKAIEKKHGSR